MKSTVILIVNTSELNEDSPYPCIYRIESFAPNTVEITCNAWNSKYNFEHFTYTFQLGENLKDNIKSKLFPPLPSSDTVEGQMMIECILACLFLYNESKERKSVVVQLHSNVNIFVLDETEWSLNPKGLSLANKI